MVPDSASYQPAGNAALVPEAARLSKSCTAGVPPTSDTTWALALPRKATKRMAMALRAPCMKFMGIPVVGAPEGRARATCNYR